MRSSTGIERGAVLALCFGLFGAASCNILFNIDGGKPAGAGGSGGTTTGTTSIGGTTGGTTSIGGSTGGSTGGTAGSTGGTGATGPCAASPDGQATKWAKHPTANYEEDGQAITVLPNGDAVVAGFYDNNDFIVESLDPLPYPDDDGGPGQKQNVFVARYSASGAPVKSLGIIGSDTQLVTSMAADPQGNLVVGGFMLGTMTLGADQFTVDEQYTPIAVDGFVFKLDGNLQPKWAKQLGGQSADEVRAVATDSQGNVLVLGVAVYTGSDYDAAPAQLPVNFGCPAQAQMLDKSEDRAYLTKLDPDGNCLWSNVFVLDLRYYGLYGEPDGLTMTVDKDDNVLVAGGFGGTANFGGGYILNAQDSKDIFVYKCDPSGATQWAENYGGQAYQVVNTMKTDAAGDIWIGGHWQVGINLGAALSEVDPLLDMNDRKGYVAKLALDAAPNLPPKPVLLHAFNDVGRIDVRSAAITPDGDAVFGGTLLPHDGALGIDFGDGQKTPPAPKNAAGDHDWDAFLVKYCKDGDVRWSRRYQTSAGEIIESVGVDGAGHTYATGEFSGVYDFEGPIQLTPLGWDAFVLRVGP